MVRRCYWFGSSALRGENERLHPVATMAAPRHPLRSHILTLFRRGDLVSVAEAVMICDASRQAISRWIKLAHLDVGRARLRYIARQRDRAQRIVDGKPPRRGPSKAEMRKATDKAIEAFNRRQS